MVPPHALTNPVNNTATSTCFIDRSVLSATTHCTRRLTLGVSYRDDVDSLYMRASALQRELDRAQTELAQRDAELAAMRNRATILEWPRADPLPLRELPAAETTLAQLIETFVPRPVPATTTPPPSIEPVKVLEAARQRLSQLDAECLVLVGAIIEELAMEPARRDELLARLRPIVARIAGAHRVA